MMIIIVSVDKGRFNWSLKELMATYNERNLFRINTHFKSQRSLLVDKSESDSDSYLQSGGLLISSFYYLARTFNILGLI
jgi:hypothetical protein